MKLPLALLVAASIPTRTEGDVRAAHATLKAEVGKYHRRSIPAPAGLFAAYKQTGTYLDALERSAA